ncbi:methyltransferase domain-containing protein [Zavarzinia sp. CC-PAN008]|uniref:methyltransferase domain-containing protein n=1 Tax=Zavarzinia sp. CC-PAN008 TaxID=3243332 RepID=UPI003F747C1B
MSQINHGTDAGGASVFDRVLLARRRQRAAPGFAAHRFLKAELAERLVERVGDVNRRFPLALDLGCHDGSVGAALLAGGRVDRLVSADLAPGFAGQAPGLRLAADEERLPFAEASFDLVVSAFSLHWVNDLPGALIQIRRVLKPDGLFIACLAGAGTLAPLRQAWFEAEEATLGGITPRVAPLPALEDGAALLQRAGLALPVADSDSVRARWPDALALLRDLKGMAEGNILAARRRQPTRRDTLGAALAAYPADDAGAVEGRFEILWLTGWAPSPDQPQPLRPGSATMRLADAIDRVRGAGPS